MLELTKNELEIIALALSEKLIRIGEESPDFSDQKEFEVLHERTLTALNNILAELS